MTEQSDSSGRSDILQNAARRFHLDAPRWKTESEIAEARRGQAG